MKASLVVLLIVTIFVAGITLAYKSAQSLMFIKPGTSLFSLGEIGPSGGGVWRYTIASGAWQQEKQVTAGSLTSSHIFAFVRDPGNAQNAYAATSAGLYRYEGSKDAWTYLANGMPSDTQVLSASVNTQNHIFITTLQGDGTSAIWRSEDAGTTFTRMYATSLQGEKIVDVVDDW